ncbi:ABC-three component system protein, partial [Nocardia sp. NPDC058497]|uniref:ABC-three component system protein n=1 Tax=Nocardia sp. NPDC058497 TaxID=3346529 RepID=UPI00365E391D
EDLFHKLMESKYPDYMPIRTNGPIGDLGGDGLRTRTRELFACYGPESFDVSAVRKKFLDDVASAIIQRPEQFDSFVFVHNDRRSGIHPVISGLLSNAGDAYPKLEFRQMGPRKLWLEAMRFDRMTMEHLLNERIPIEREAYSIGMADIEPLLSHLAENREPAGPVDGLPIPTVYKADYNRLAEDDRSYLQSGRTDAYLIDRYYRASLNVWERDEVAASFRAHYEMIREDCGDDSSEMLYQMRVFVHGEIAPKMKAEKATNAVLAYFFDQCDIFEVPPGGWVPALSETGAGE